MFVYILIVVTMGYGGDHYVNKDYPIVAMQEFNGVKACQFAAEQIKQRAGSDRIKMVCVPKSVR